MIDAMTLIVSSLCKALIMTAPQLSTRAEYMILSDRKRCGDVSHSESISCEISSGLICFAKLWECVRVLASLFELHHRFPTQTGERDIFQRYVCRSREGVGY